MDLFIDFFLPYSLYCNAMRLLTSILVIEITIIDFPVAVVVVVIY